MDDLKPGESFAGCRIEAVVGRGGMGVVYRATEIALQRRVALKVVAPESVADAGFAERFGREVRLAASIDHPNVVPVYGAGREGDRLYLVMRYVDGTDLHALIAKAGPLAPSRAAAIVAQLAAGLDAAHAAGLVHRDVKPANALLTSSGAQAGGDHVYLTDFGLTVEVSSDARMTTTGHWIGSVDYMAPEQLRAEPVDARTDVYALGGVLHAALTGQAPFRRGTVPQTIAAHLNDAPPRPTALVPVDPVFDAVVGRALAKDPAERYGSAGDLGRAALAAVRGERLTAGERVVARGPAAPSEDLTTRLPRPPVPAPPAPKTRRAVSDDDVIVPVVRRPRPIAPSPARPRPAVPEPAAARPPVPAPAASGPPVPAPAASGSAVPSPAASGSAVPAPTDSPPPVPAAPASRPPAVAPSRPHALQPPDSKDPAAAPDGGGSRRHRSRGRLPLGIAALFAAAAAVAVIAAVTGGERARVVSASLSADEVRGAAQDFAAAYGDEDAEALRATLTRNVRRVGPDGGQQGAGVLAVYRRQFAEADVESYELDDIEIVPGAAGRAAGRYTVRRAGREDIAGRVAFGVIRDGGRPRIALIATQPD